MEVECYCVWNSEYKIADFLVYFGRINLDRPTALSENEMTSPGWPVSKYGSDFPNVNLSRDQEVKQQNQTGTISSFCSTLLLSGDIIKRFYRKVIRNTAENWKQY